MKKLINNKKYNSFKIDETEKRIIEILRNKDFQKVSVIIRKGLPVRLEVEEEMQRVSDDKMNIIIKEKDHQSVS